MKFNQHYSSSAGNLYEIMSVNGERLLIEAGVVWPKMRRALNNDLHNIQGCLLSHEHADHSKAAKDVMKAGIDIYASYGTLRELDLLEERRAKLLRPEKLTMVGNFSVMPFPVRHDAAEPMGFIIIADNKALLFLTDTGSLDYTFRTPFEIVAIECSYNKKYLQKRVDKGEIPKTVAKRLLLNHMEESETLRTLQNFINLDKCREIHLLHLSADNINKERVKKKFEKELMIETIII